MAPASVSLNSVYSYLTAYDSAPAASAHAHAQLVTFIGCQPIQVNVDDPKLTRPYDVDVQHVIVSATDPAPFKHATSGAKDDESASTQDPTSTPEPGDAVLQQISTDIRDVCDCVVVGIYVNAALLIAILFVLLGLRNDERRYRANPGRRT